jgi:hypothetical protein
MQATAGRAEVFVGRIRFEVMIWSLLDSQVARGRPRYL